MDGLIEHEKATAVDRSRSAGRLRMGSSGDRNIPALLEQVATKQSNSAPVLFAGRSKWPSALS